MTETVEENRKNKFSTGSNRPPSYSFGTALTNGKVYRVQNPNLPFAAVHWDHDI